MEIFKLLRQFSLRKIPVYFILILIVICSAVIFCAYNNSNLNTKIGENTNLLNKSCLSDMLQVRINDYKFTHPLILSDIANESDELSTLKNQIIQFIDSKKNNNELTNASVYVRKLNNGRWMNINGEMGFHPGSLIKVPILITYLKYAESNPALLNKLIKYEKPFTNMPNQAFPEETIVIGKSYSVLQLIEAMIEKSDNAATMLLIQNVNMSGFKKLFVDLGLPEPPEKDPNFMISSINVSKFFRVLYNSTYLNSNNSEYALTLLSKCDFKEGLLNQLPENLVVSHKFGEQGDKNSKELHEIGIIYLNNDPYLLAIMTQGKNMKSLSGIISEISKMVYNQLNVNI